MSTVAMTALVKVSSVFQLCGDSGEPSVNSSKSSASYDAQLCVMVMSAM